MRRKRQHRSILHVREKVRIEAAGLAERLRSDQHAGPGRPEHLSFIVVLPRVLLRDLEDPATAEGIAVPIDETTRRTGMLELAGLLQRAHLRLAGRHARVLIEVGVQGVEPARRHLNIRVQQQEAVRLHLCQSRVITASEAKVPGKFDHAYRRMFPTQPTYGVIRARVIRYDDLRSRTVPDGGGQEPLQPGTAVPVQYDDGDVHPDRGGGKDAAIPVPDSARGVEEFHHPVALQGARLNGLHPGHGHVPLMQDVVPLRIVHLSRDLAVQ